MNQKQQLKMMAENLRMLKKTYAEMLNRNADKGQLKLLSDSMKTLRHEIQEGIKRATDGLKSINKTVPEAPKLFKEIGYGTMEKMLDTVEESDNLLRKNLYLVKFDGCMDIPPYYVRSLTHYSTSHTIAICFLNHIQQSDGINVTFSYLLEQGLKGKSVDIYVERLSKDLRVLSREVFRDVNVTNVMTGGLEYKDDGFDEVHATFEYAKHEFLAIEHEETTSKEGESQGEQESSQQEDNCPQGERQEG